jgi:hypothetical protein
MPKPPHDRDLALRLRILHYTSFLVPQNHPALLAQGLLAWKNREHELKISPEKDGLSQ